MYRARPKLTAIGCTLLFFSCLNTYVFAQQGKKIKTIIVDPGHGGQDAGAKSEYEGSLGTFEKNITLAISMKLVEELKKQLPGTKIIPSRTTDIFMNPREKAKFANDNHGDLFVCVHADAVTLKTGSRIIGYHTESYTTTRYVGKGRKKRKIVTPHTHQVPTRQYFKIPSTRKGTSTLIFAVRKTGDKIKAMENSDVLFNADENDTTLEVNYNSPEWKANALLYTQNYFKRSFKLASDIQDEVAGMGRSDLGVWQRDKGIWVLQATQMPAVLIETGFITTPDDEKYLNSEKGQQEIVEAIARAVKKFKDQVENPKLASPTESTK